MVDKINVDNGQLQKLQASIDALQDHAPYWKQFLITAAPIFLASLLGLTTALLLDWLKTRREKRNAVRERLEKELVLLSGVNTAIAFNISALIHTVTQQILPHYECSHAARKEIENLDAGSEYHRKKFFQLLHSKFQPMMKRCPIPHLEDINLSKDLPFLIAKNPRLIMLSGWIITYIQYLKSILNDRNKLIDKATIENPNDYHGIPNLKWQIEAQANISDAEVVNSYQLFLQFKDASQKIENIVDSQYKNVVGPKLKIQPPEIFSTLIDDLERIVRGIIPDLPPPEPPTF